MPERKDVTIRVPPAVVRAEAGGATAKTRANMWIKWAEIAMAHEGQALSARKTVEGTQGTEGFGEALDEELLAALVTVAASAFALEAFANHLDDWLGLSVPAAAVQHWKRQGRRLPAAVRVVELVKVGFTVSAHAKRWETEVSRLFDLRNDAVHFRSEWNELVPHYTGKSDVSREVTIYSGSEASWSVDLAVDVINTCLKAPRPDQPQVVEWATQTAHVVQHLSQHRANATP